MKQAALERIWYEGDPPGPLLGALERVYRVTAAKRRERERARSDSSLEGRAIVVVGNITVGGTGKTPLVVRLCELLAEAGLQPAVVSRGYGRDSRGPLDVTPDADSADTGDEPLLIARRCGVPVRVDRDREAAARHAFDAGADVVIADDGLQRLRLPRALEICVIDGARGFGNGRLLPAGPLREPVDRLAEVDWIVVNGDADPNALELPIEKTVTMRLAPDAFVPLGGGETVDAARMADRLQDRAASAVTGIGNARRFFDTLRGLGIDPDHERAFEDHHRFESADFAGLDGPVLMTEKDAVKCGDLGLEDAWFLRVGARLDESWERALVRRIEAIAEAGPS